MINGSCPFCGIWLEPFPSNYAVIHKLNCEFQAALFFPIVLIWHGIKAVYQFLTTERESR